MLLYTVMPLETIFAEPEEERAGVAAAEQMMEIGGVPVMIRADGAGGAVITRLLSTDPQHYLDPQWQPGARVRI